MNLQVIALNILKIVMGLSAGLVISELVLHGLFPIQDQTKYYSQIPNLRQTFKPDP